MFIFGLSRVILPLFSFLHVIVVYCIFVFRPDRYRHNFFYKNRLIIAIILIFLNLLGVITNALIWGLT